MTPPKNYSYEEYLHLMTDSSGARIKEESTGLIERFRGKQQINTRNTINNHHKSMLLQTNCKTSAEFMNYSAKHGLLHENK